MASWKESNTLNKLRKLREANGITVYAGIWHDEYEDPIFSKSAARVRNCDYTAKITAPAGTYVMFKWCDENCYFTITPSPGNTVKNWVEELKTQIDNGESDWVLEDEISGGLYLDKEEYPTPEEAAQEAYDITRNQEPEGDSNYGVIWQKIENFV